MDRPQQISVFHLRLNVNSALHLQTDITIVGVSCQKNFPHVIATRLLKTRCRFFLALSFGMSSTDQESAKTISSEKPAGTLGWRERTIGAVLVLAAVAAMAG
jgi:hypothetical protein